MTTLNPIVSQKLAKSQQFFKMTAERAKSDYKIKLITAEAYILYIIESNRSAGWKWTFDPKEFCAEWEISKSTFYRAISSLKARGKINWETTGKITVWHGADIPMHETENPTDKNPSPTCENPSPIHNTVSPTCETEIPTDGTVIPQVGISKAETVTQLISQDSTDIKQIFTDLKESGNIISFPDMSTREREEKDEEVALESAPQLPEKPKPKLKEKPVQEKPTQPKYKLSGEQTYYPTVESIPQEIKQWASEMVGTAIERTWVGQDGVPYVIGLNHIPMRLDEFVDRERAKTNSQLADCLP